jgi:fumarate reductase flavoprotein subunit
LSENDFNLTRRKFIAAGSAAIAAPIVMNMAGKVAESKAEEKKTYYINDNCIVCIKLLCKTNCPSGAVYFDGEKMAINTEKCIRCGKCSELCPLSAVMDASAPPTVHKPHDIIHKNCDMLVVGGGASGLVAAANAADLSGKKVIVLEKAKKAGGSGYFPVGIGPLNSTKWQRDAGIAGYNIDDAIRSAMNSTRWQLNPQLVANSLRALPSFFDWFCTWGKAEEIFTMNKEGISIKNWEAERTYKVMLKLIEKCKELGVEILTEHAGMEFIMGDRGEISGVKAKDPGGMTIINCRFCLVATGSVVSCSSLMARCVPEYVNALVRRSGHRLPTNTGDGVLMSEKAGIPVDYKSVCVHYTGPNSSLAEEQVRMLDQRGEGLYVNFNGDRWVNETFVYTSAEEFNWVLLNQPRCMFYNVMDSNIITMEPLPKLSITSGRMSGAPDGQGGAQDGQGGPPIQKKPDLKELQRIASLPGRHVIIANTLEELADKMGVERKRLIATVKRYNELCAKGHDDDYFKPEKYMLPIEKGPFYASSHFLGTDGAFGGLAINENMQVMGHDGPVKGLYASGDTTGSRFLNRGGEKTDFIADMPWAMASGWIAGEHIGRLLKAV